MGKSCSTAGGHFKDYVDYYMETKPTKRPQEKSPSPRLGVIRLDYPYPPASGDIDYPGSFGYEVIYRVVPGFTFLMCQMGEMTEEVELEFISAVRWLSEVKKVSVITGDCGFMMWNQKIARNTIKHKPIVMSPLCQLPAVTCAYSQREQIIIMTADSVTLEPMRDLIRDECGVDTQDERFHIVGCQDVKGFEAVANGTKVNTKVV